MELPGNGVAGTVTDKIAGLSMDVLLAKWLPYYDEILTGNLRMRRLGVMFSVMMVVVEDDDDEYLHWKRLMGMR